MTIRNREGNAMLEAMENIDHPFSEHAGVMADMILEYCDEHGLTVSRCDGIRDIEIEIFMFLARGKDGML